MRKIIFLRFAKLFFVDLLLFYNLIFIKKLENKSLSAALIFKSAFLTY